MTLRGESEAAPGVASQYRTGWPTLFFLVPYVIAIIYLAVNPLTQVFAVVEGLITVLPLAIGGLYLKGLGLEVKFNPRVSVLLVFATIAGLYAVNAVIISFFLRSAFFGQLTPLTALISLYAAGIGESYLLLFFLYRLEIVGLKKIGITGYPAIFLAILPNAGVFVLLHTASTYTTNALGVWYFIYVAGLVFPALYEYTRELWVPIAAHSGFDLFPAIFALYVFPQTLHLIFGAA